MYSLGTSDYPCIGIFISGYLYFRYVTVIGKNNEKKPGQIFSKELVIVNRNTKALMPAEEIIKRRLRRQKSKNNSINPNSLNQLRSY
jgi:hypothetical protein